MKRSRVPTDPQLPVGAAPPDPKYESGTSSHKPSDKRGKSLEESLRLPDCVGDFLKHCKLCRVPMKNNQASYMYKDFGVYCSIECREVHMDIDEKIEQALQKQKIAENAKAKGSN